MLTLGMFITIAGCNTARIAYSSTSQWRKQEPIGSIEYVWPWVYMFRLDQNSGGATNDLWDNKMYYYYWAWTWSIVTITAWVIAIRRATVRISRKMKDGS